MLSGTPARVDVKTGAPAPLDVCETSTGEADGVHVTRLACSGFDGASAFASTPDATYAAIFSQSRSLLVTFPRAGAARVERLPFWAALSLSPRGDGLDAATAYEWQSLAHGAWTPVAHLPQGVTALAWLWEPAGPRVFARVGGTLGSAIETFRWANGAWTRVPFWPSASRAGTPPVALDATRLGDEIFTTWVPTYDGAAGLFVARESGAPIHALASVAPRTGHASLARLPRESWPIVAVQSGDDAVVAWPSGASYASGTIPGDDFAALARRPPARADREPAMRAGVARCSEVTDAVSSDRLFSPVVVTRSGAALLLFVRHHVERRHRWTLVPARASSFCDWLEERAIETTEVVVAALAGGPTPTARELLAIPFSARVSDFDRPRLAAALAGDALDVVVAAGSVIEHVTIDARRLP